MVLVQPSFDDSLLTDATAPFPAEVEFVISALEAGPKPLIDRQKARRSQYRVRATLKLFSDAAEAKPALLYTRNVTSQALAFLTNDVLTLSHGGILRIPSPSGEILKINCTVLRYREGEKLSRQDRFAFQYLDWQFDGNESGWYECSPGAGCFAFGVLKTTKTRRHNAFVSSCLCGDYLSCRDLRSVSKSLTSEPRN